MRILRGHKKAVYCLAFLPGGRLAAGGLEGEVSLWDILTGERRVVAREKQSVEWVAASPCGAWLAYCGERLWVHVAGGSEGWWPSRLPMRVTDGNVHYSDRACAFAPDGRTLVSVGSGVRRWRVEGWELGPWAEDWWGQRAAGCPAFAPDGRTLATGAYVPEGGRGWTVCLWDAHEGVSRPAFPPGHPFTNGLVYTNLAYSPDGRLLAGLCFDEVRVWGADTGEVVYRSRPALGQMHGLAFSPDGRLLATGGNDGLVTLLETATWSTTARYDWKLAKVLDVAFSSDGMLLAACGSRGKVVVWDVDE